MDRPGTRVKRAKAEQDIIPDSSDIRSKRARFLSSLSRQVSPPPSTIAELCEPGLNLSVPVHDDENTDQIPISRSSSDTIDLTTSDPGNGATAVRLRSPIQLTHIRDLSASENADTVGLHDILGDPLIKEIWIFNFCFDIEWMMQYFDQDVRQSIKIKIVHGSWRREDTNKICIDEACGRWPNIEAIQAYLPDAFGTHHSKMFIVFRHDDQAQIVIHTANMLQKDWTNMTQAVWQSPMLPLQTKQTDEEDAVGSGPRFKHDLLCYLKAYGNRLKPLGRQLTDYDFNDVKATLIASVPSEFTVAESDDKVWGHESLHRALKAIPTKSEKPHYVYQVSSIASLPHTWLAETLYAAIGPDANTKSTSIIFPTAEDVRTSLDGYAAGGSIHTKAQSAVHLRQISLLRPQLCRWTNSNNKKAGRESAAPHIKTYIRFTTRPSKEQPTPDIEWVLVTSANLSTQAWGSAPKMKGTNNRQEATIKVQSFEIGVLIWPALFDAGKHDGKTIMVPTFKKDLPDTTTDKRNSTVVGLRMPYDLPLESYSTNEMPWSPQSSYDQPDSQGVIWR